MGNGFGSSERPAGWYPDKRQPNVQHYWNGSLWVASRRWVSGTWHEVRDADPIQGSGSRAAQSHRSESGTWVLALALVVLVATGVAMGVIISSNHSSSNSDAAATTTTGAVSTRAAATNTSAFQCQKDWRIVTIAVMAYQHLHHANPDPPLPWSVANYRQDYAPLTHHTGNHEALLPANYVPSSSHYEVYYDAHGNVFVSPPGQFSVVSTQANPDEMCNEVTAGNP